MDAKGVAYLEERKMPTFSGVSTCQKSCVQKGIETIFFGPEKSFLLMAFSPAKPQLKFGEKTAVKKLERCIVTKITAL